MKGFVLFLALWGVVILGGLPKVMQQELECRFSWFHARIFGLISSFLEFLCGFGLLRLTLLASGLHRITAPRAIMLGVIGLFFLTEGLLRLGLTLNGNITPSLPVVLIARLLRPFFRTA